MWSGQFLYVSTLIAETSIIYLGERRQARTCSSRKLAMPSSFHLSRCTSQVGLYRHELEEDTPCAAQQMDLLVPDQAAGVAGLW